MSEPAEGAASGPLEYRTTIVEDWIDYNGHLSEAFYVLIFGFATDEVMVRIGLGPAEREATGSSLYTVEAHVRYVHEVSLGAEVLVRTRIVGSGAKKLHLAHEMVVPGGAGAEAAGGSESDAAEADIARRGTGPASPSDSEVIVATEEIMSLHVAGEPASTAPFPAAVADRIAQLTDSAPAPDWLGRSIG